ncbi:transcriptional regulator [Priestia aryabhattai]|uniref:helix-turn-helix domain-containing protein n=1 Tax=Priestia aryabhattai TaxID=412384 RepID=UPI000B4FD9E2|nr:helix-turn-helix transcriptional regulator [Priestia aryabhattai]OVE34876.1 transcriptional regulator [Priestia aryabhattai]
MFAIKPRLNDLMKQRGLTQMKLSEMTGVPQSSISRFDRNTQHIDWHLFKIAKALEISIEDLFEIEE